MSEEVENYVKNPSPILKKVEVFRQEIKSNLEKVVLDVESGVENTLLDHSKNPDVYPVFTPEETEVDEDRLLIAISIAMFELAHPSDQPLHDKLKNTREAAVGRTAEALLNGFREEKFKWSAKYEKSDNSILFNELPEKILPDKSEVPPVLAYLWNGINTSVDAGVDRNYEINIPTLEAKVAHEMTHALNTQASKPLKNNKTAAIDEAAAMASTYAIAGEMPDTDYSEEGINKHDLDQAKNILGRFVNKRGHRKETLSLLRNISIRSINNMASKPGLGIEEALETAIKNL